MSLATNVSYWDYDQDLLLRHDAGCYALDKGAGGERCGRGGDGCERCGRRSRRLVRTTSPLHDRSRRPAALGKGRHKLNIIVRKTAF
eukprot:5854463-Prymnesium_polylepis.1